MNLKCICSIKPLSINSQYLGPKTVVQSCGNIAFADSGEVLRCYIVLLTKLSFCILAEEFSQYNSEYRMHESDLSTTLLQ